MNVIPHNRPFLGEEEAKAVEAVITSNWIIAGKEVEKFENELKAYVGKKYAIALNSGHSALHLSLLALGIKDNDEVIIPSYVAPALLNVIYYCRAVPVVIDCEKAGFNIDPQKVAQKLTKRSKAMIIPHLFGFPANIEQLKEYNIPIIEDCAQSIGTTYRGKPLGCYGDVCIFSFYASKVITTGQGGMVLTDRDDYNATIRDLINYNMQITYRTRYNYPMTDIAAAIGNVQYAELQTFIDKRKTIGDRYRGVLRKKNVKYYPGDNDHNINHFRFLIQLKDNDELLLVQEEFAKRRIITIIPYLPNEAGHRILHLDNDEFGNAEHIMKTTLSIPIFSGLTEEESARVMSALDETL